MISIVNRCQTQIQKSLGSPAQVSQVDEYKKDFSAIDRRLEAVDKRIDLLHTVYFLPFPFILSFLCLSNVKCS
jgi:hypothetical protein